MKETALASPCTSLSGDAAWQANCNSEELEDVCHQSYHREKLRIQQIYIPEKGGKRLGAQKTLDEALKATST